MLAGWLAAGCWLLSGLRVRVYGFVVPLAESRVVIYIHIPFSPNELNPKAFFAMLNAQEPRAEPELPKNCSRTVPELFQNCARTVPELYWPGLAWHGLAWLGLSAGWLAAG